MSSLRRAGSAVGIAAVALIVAFATLPGHTLFSATLQNSAHAPAFALVTLLMANAYEGLSRYRRLTPLRKAVTLIASAVLLGTLIEVVQSFTHGDAEAYDVYSDFLGAWIGLGILALASRTQLQFAGVLRKVVLAGALIAIIAALTPITYATAAYATRDREFPTLLGGSWTFDRYFMQGCKPHGDNRSGGWTITLRDDCEREINLEEPYPDWSAFQRLDMHLTNLEAHPIVVTLRVHDAVHNFEFDDRFNVSVTLAPREERTFSFPLASIQNAPAGRAMDLRKIAGVILFSAARSEPTIVLHRVWLE